MTSVTVLSRSMLPSLALLAACTSATAPTTAGPGTAVMPTCRADAAAALVGKPAPAAAAIRQRTGAASVRRIAPGDMVTQDYRPDRITVTVDPAGTIVAARCG